MVTMPRYRIRPLDVPLKRTGKAMTIALAFDCEDGIVVCADSQLTKGDLKYYENKILRVGQPFGWWNAVFTYCGDPQLAKLVYEKLAGQLYQRLVEDPVHGPAASSFRLYVETAIASVLEKHPDGAIETLCAFTKGKESVLLRTLGRTVAHTGFDCLGIGDSALVRYLVAGWEKFYLSLNVYQALLLGIHIVHHAKRYIEGCGGETNAVILRGGRCEEVRLFVPAAELRLEEICDEFTHLLYSFSNPTVSDEEFETVGNVFVSQLKGLRLNKRWIHDGFM